MTFDTAPKDGTRIQMKNAENGLFDVGAWCSWADMPDWQRQMIPDFARDWDGEWETDLGNGDMTHWRPL